MRDGKRSDWARNLPAAGVILTALALSADLVGLGGRPGFGKGQGLLFVLGVLLLATGFVARFGSLRQKLEPGASGLTRLYRWAAFSCFNVVLLIAGLELWGVLVDRYDGLPAPETRAPYYASQPWAQQHWREFDRLKHQVRYRRYQGWQTPPYQGETIHVDPRGVRRTPGASPAADAFTALAFGGSAMWGHGAPDAETIPAYLQAGLSAETERPVRVENFGERGFVATQSLIQLIAELQAERVPDLVIFYHGFNDVAVALRGDAGGHFEEARIAARLERPLSTWLGATQALKMLRRLLPERRENLDQLPSAELDHRSASAVRHYLGTHRVLEALAREYDFDVFCFWQPVLTLSRKRLSPKEVEIRANDPPVLAALLSSVYAEIGRLAEGRERLHSLVEVLDGEDEQIWIDPVHVTPAGNRIIAEAILDVVRNRRDGCGTAVD